jgi:exosortase
MSLKPMNKADRNDGARNPVFWAGVGVVAVTVAATYWSSLAGLAGRWWNEADYIHGFLVAPFAALMLWLRRDMLPGAEARGSLWAIAFLVLAAAMRMVSSYYYYDLLDPLSLIPCLAGIALFAGGWKALRWAWPGVVFLVFMLPLPGFLATLMSHPLQRFATRASLFVIQTIGIPAVAEGNVIHLSDSQIGVEEACNGLHNMMLFLAVCVGVAFIIRRSVAEKIIIVASAAGIALVANVIRITVTAILNEYASHHVASTVYHGLVGFFMMPLAVVLLWLELAYLSRVFVNRTDTDFQPLTTDL